MSVIRVGSSTTYASGWDTIFGGGKGRTAGKKSATKRKKAKPAGRPKAVKRAKKKAHG